MDVNICLCEHAGEFVHLKCLKHMTLVWKCLSRISCIWMGLVSPEEVGKYANSQTYV